MVIDVKYLENLLWCLKKSRGINRMSNGERRETEDYIDQVQVQTQVLIEKEKARLSRRATKEKIRMADLGKDPAYVDPGFYPEDLPGG